MTDKGDMIARCKWICDEYNKMFQGDARPAVYESSAFAFYQAGFTEGDLTLVMAHIQRENARREPKYRVRVRLSKLIGDLEMFNDWLSEARAHERQRLARKKPADVVAKEGWRGLPDGGKMPEPKRMDMDLVVKSLQQWKNQ